MRQKAMALYLSLLSCRTTYQGSGVYAPIPWNALRSSLKTSAKLRFNAPYFSRLFFIVNNQTQSSYPETENENVEKTKKRELAEPGNF